MALVPALWNGQYIIKQLDEVTGYFYYTNQNTGEVYWDKPAGVDVVLRSAEPPPEELEEKCRQRGRAAAERKERQELIEKQLALRRKAAAERDAAAGSSQAARVDELWRVAEEHAVRRKGHFSLCWHRLGAISPRLWKYHERHGGSGAPPLVSIALVGQALERVPPELVLGRHAVAALTSLSLAANALTALPDEICGLAALRSLNLLGNALRELPARIGALAQLRRLELAGNKLEALPPSFGNLTRLKRIVLDCNRLRALPETLGTLRCTHLSLNFNRLGALPRCVKDMPRLRALRVDGNGLRALPGEIGAAPRLATLSVCGNRLTQLPDSLCALAALRRLWLDHNFLAGLPSDFHRLEALEELRLEGNRHMVYPGPETVAAGVAAVRAWCRRRFNDRIHARRHTIVLTVQDALQQLAESGLASAAHFEPDVRVLPSGAINMSAAAAAAAAGAPPPPTAPSSASEQQQRSTRRSSGGGGGDGSDGGDGGAKKSPQKGGDRAATADAAAAAAAAVNKAGDLYYALVWDKLWEEMLPALERRWGEGGGDTRGHVTTFPYTRDEVEAVLKEYRDPLGRVMRTQAVMFRRCACVNPETGRRRVCVPPRPGWMCERQATLIRRTIVLEREQMERQRARQEERDIEFRVQLARKVVKEYSESEEGRLHYQEMAIAKAEKLTREKAAGQHQNEADMLLAHRMNQVDAKFDKEVAKALKAKEVRLRDMKAKLNVMEAECEKLRGWALEQKEAQMATMTKLMQRVPEDDALAEIEARRKAAHEDAKGRADTATLKATRKLLAKKVQRNDAAFLELVAELIADGVAADMEREGAAARRSGAEEHAVLRRVMGLWLGMGMREAFADWKAWTKRRIKLRRRDRHQAVRQAWQRYETNSVAMEMARWNVDKWLEQWDAYNDVPFWVHATTGAIRWDPPTVPEYLPPGYQEPKPPSDRVEDLSESESEWSDVGGSSTSGSRASSRGSGGSSGGSDSEGSSGSGSSGSRSSSGRSGSRARDSARRAAPAAEQQLLALENGAAPAPPPLAIEAGTGTQHREALVATGVAEWQSAALVSLPGGALDAYAAGGGGSGGDVYDAASGGEMVPYSNEPDPLAATAARVAKARVAEAERAARRMKATRRRHVKQEGKMRQERAEARAEAARTGSMQAPLKIEEAMAVVGYDRDVDYSHEQMTAMAATAMELMLKQKGDTKALDKYGTYSKTLLGTKVYDVKGLGV